MNRLLSLTIGLLGSALLPVSNLAAPKRLSPTITWEIVDTTLYVTGTGDIPNFRGTSIPWASQDIASDIREIVVSEGITSVGDYTFCNAAYDVKAAQIIGRNQEDAVQTFKGYFNNVRRIHLPSTLTKIGAFAFQNIQVTEINIPENVTSIGALAFNLSNLRYVKLPAGLKKLGYSAFESCVNLVCVDFNGAKIRLPKGAFFACERLQQPLNTMNVTEIHELAVDQSPLGRVPNIMALFQAQNFDRYLCMNFMPWGEYVAQYINEAPIAPYAELSAVEKDLASWKMRKAGESPAKWEQRVNDITYAERRDSLWLEVAKRNPAKNEIYLSNHQIVQDRWESDEVILADSYFDFLTESNRRLVALDNFSLGQYDNETGCFIISSTHHGDFIVRVPAEQAGVFTASWPAIAANIQPRIVRKDDNVVLRNLILSLPDSSATFAAAPVRR